MPAVAGALDITIPARMGQPSMLIDQRPAGPPRHYASSLIATRQCNARQGESNRPIITLCYRPVTPEPPAAKAQASPSHPHAAAKRGRCMGPRYRSLACFFLQCYPPVRRHTTTTTTTTSTSRPSFCCCWACVGLLLSSVYTSLGARCSSFPRRATASASMPRSAVPEMHAADNEALSQPSRARC